MEINGKRSKSGKITMGVIQGSILGPLLYLIFVNDLPGATYLKSQMFADDTNFLARGGSIKDMEEKINIELGKVADWFTANKLSLNTKKTHYMIFKKRKKIISTISLQINGEEIKRVISDEGVKFLGYRLNEKICWNNHIEEKLRKAKKGIFALLQVKNILPIAARKSIYHALVHTHLSTGSILWYPMLSKEKRQEVEIVQKQAIRALCGAPYRSHSEPLLKKTHVLKISDVFKKESVIFVKRILDGGGPSSFNSLMEVNSHRYSTRTVATTIKTTNRRSNSLMNIIAVWNELKIDCSSTNLVKYKKEVTEELIKKYEDECKEINCYICQK